MRVVDVAWHGSNAITLMYIDRVGPLGGSDLSRGTTPVVRKTAFLGRGPPGQLARRSVEARSGLHAVRVATTIEPGPVPLARDELGRLMVVGTRVPLETLVAGFEQGETPEEIHGGFPTVGLADVYAVLAYRVRHRAEVEAYVAERECLGSGGSVEDRGQFPVRRAACQTARGAGQPAGRVTIPFSWATGVGLFYWRS